MFCPQCGHENPDGTQFCAMCGSPMPGGAEQVGPQSSGAPESPFGFADSSQIVPVQPFQQDYRQQGYQQGYQQQGYQQGYGYQQQTYQQTAYPNAVEKSKIAAGLLAIFLGAFGIHKFYLGITKPAVTMLVLTLVGFVLSLIVIGVFLVAVIEIIAFVEGIIYLCKSDEEFYYTYVVNKKPWF